MNRAEPLGRAATYEDLRQVPDHRIAQIVNGELWVSPRPALRHAHVASMLSVELIVPFGQGRGGPGGWWILYEPEIHFHGDVLVPDFAAWKLDRQLKIDPEAHMTQPPDWICEIMSPSTRKLDRILKLGIYGREGVHHAWLIDPDKRSLEVMKLAARTWVPIATLKNDAIAAAEPFAAVPFPLTRLWPDF